MGYSILIAEDDKVLRGSLTRNFRKGGFTVYATGSSAEAIQLAEQFKPDCYLLDYHLVGGTAEDICKFVRGNEVLKKAPILILSGDSGQAVNSYEACQADVFLKKGGASYLEMLALAKRQVRRVKWEGSSSTKSDLALDHTTQSVVKDYKSEIYLSGEQFRLFTILFNQSPCYVTEEELSAFVFRDLPADRADAIAALVYRLRQKLGPRLSKRIKTHRNRGWVYLQPRLRRKDPAPDLLSA